MTQANLRNRFKKVSTCVNASIITISPAPFVLLQQLLQLQKLQKTEEYPDDPKPADEGEIHIEYSSYGPL
jgi:hypothetical protein